MKDVIIVESPAKAKTIEKYLKDKYHVVSSKGHICDLATSGKGNLGIDIENGFIGKYIISKDKQKVVTELKKTIKNVNNVYLASDPDREGEAIAWHLARILDLDLSKNNRIVFNEITKTAVSNALETPRQVNMNLVHSQEGRRMLDRIIGFKLSSLIRNKIKSKSAGRVQSVALKLICDREEEINNFVPKEYWNLEATIEKDGISFKAKASKYKNKKIQLNNEKQAIEAYENCNGDYVIDKITTKNKKRQPKLPFITSTLQQEASSKLNFSAKKTMMVAQKLYEGIELENGLEGLITYMRSDSYRLSNDFVQGTLQYIENTYGKKYVGKYKVVKNQASQDAHEAIRVSDITKTPQSIKSFLTNDQFKLYQFIYYRTLACLMADSIDQVVGVEIVNNEVLFKAQGQTQVFDGFLKVYKPYDSSSDQLLPELEKEEILKKVTLEKSQHFTEPPLAYSEARLIKTLEELKIGRPSTYAMILETLTSRGYATLTKNSETSKVKYFHPSEQGILTNTQLQQFFESIINVSYTAQMEETLDQIAEGDLNYSEELAKFMEIFTPLLDYAYQNMEKKECEKVNRLCPQCEGELVYRESRYGKFVACSNFPKCRYSESDENTMLEEKCPQCDSQLQTKMGRYGKFIACSNYPQCKYIKNEKKPAVKLEEKCPDCGSDLVIRKSRYGKDFIGCSSYPKCRYIRKMEEKDAKS